MVDVDALSRLHEGCERTSGNSKYVGHGEKLKKSRRKKHVYQ